MLNIDYKFKIIITGSPEVGKTSIIRRYVDEKFNESYIATMQTDWTIKDVTYKGKIIRLILYELGGQSEFMQYQKRHFSQADYICAVASVDNIDSLKRIPDILNYSIETWKLKNGNKNNIPAITIINKIDKIKGSENESKIMHSFKNKLNEMTKNISHNGFLFTSAKTGENIDILFNKIASSLLFNMELKSIID